MKKLILIAPILLNACAYNSTMGVNNRFQVATTASMFAPSVTTVVDTHNDSASTYAGPSIVGQVVNAAGTVAGGYLLGQGIGKSGTKVTQQGGNTTSSALGGTSNATGGAGGNGGTGGESSSFSGSISAATAVSNGAGESHGRE